MGISLGRYIAGYIVGILAGLALMFIVGLILNALGVGYALVAKILIAYFGTALIAQAVWNENEWTEGYFEFWEPFLEWMDGVKDSGGCAVLIAFPFVLIVGIVFILATFVTFSISFIVQAIHLGCTLDI